MKAPTTINDNASEEQDEESSVAPLPRGVKNYMTPGGYARLKTELVHLLNTERPEIVKVVSWAAGNGRTFSDAEIEPERPAGMLRRLVNFLKDRV